MSTRKPEYPVHEIFLKRWSARAMSGELVEHETLMLLFEAAKWAPSSFNNQPWRFIYTTKDSDDWQRFYDLLDAYNQSWAIGASVLVVVIARTTFEKTGMPSRTHAHDTGAACENLALQGSICGLVVHAIEGFDYERAHSLVQAPEGYAVQMMIALGKPGDSKNLPERFQTREVPSGRKSLAEIVFKGSYKETKK